VKLTKHWPPTRNFGNGCAFALRRLQTTFQKEQGRLTHRRPIGHGNLRRRCRTVTSQRHPPPTTFPPQWMREFLQHGSIAGLGVGSSYRSIERLLGKSKSSGLSTRFSCAHIAKFFGGVLEIQSVDEQVSMIMFEFSPDSPSVPFAYRDGGVAAIGCQTNDQEFRQHMIGLRGSDSDFIPVATLPGCYRIGSLDAYFDEETGTLSALSVSDLSDRLHDPIPRKSHQRPRIVEPAIWGGSRLVVRAPNKVLLQMSSLTGPNMFIDLRRGNDTAQARKSFRKAESQVLWWMQNPMFMAELAVAYARVHHYSAIHEGRNLPRV
jgi:hypothetical protein